MTAIRAIHAGRRQLGIEEDDARDLYERVTGKRSLRAMNENERRAIVSELRRMGFKKASSGTRKPLEGKYAKKLRALWIALWNMGVIRNRDDAALLAFVKRQTGLDHTRFLYYAGDAKKAIEALKAMLAREGVDWSSDSAMPHWCRVDGYRIAAAQWRKLHHDDINTFQRFLAFVKQQSGKESLLGFRNTDWIPVMNELGRQIRAKQSGAK